MNAPAAAAMSNQCDLLSTITPHDEYDETPRIYRCKGEAIVRVVIIQGERCHTVKRCAGCLQLLRAQAHLGKVQIVSEQAL